MSYFDLNSAHSYNMSGPSRKRYCFVKGKPVHVEDIEDSRKFKMHTDLFFECDQFGNKLINDNANSKAKTFVQFRPEIANRDEIIAESNKKAELERVNVNVVSLLEEVNNDIAEVNTEVETEEKPFMKKTKKEKKVKNVLECDLCGYVSNNQNDLKDHLDKHSEED